MHGIGDDTAKGASALHCIHALHALSACSLIRTQVMHPPTAYENYDIPRSLGPVTWTDSEPAPTAINASQAQFYDTPRNLREAARQSPAPQNYGNYDFPQNGSVPVYR